MPIDPSVTTATTFNITANTTAPIWGYCRQSGAAPGAPTHCQSGMVFGINPSPHRRKDILQLPDAREVLDDAGCDAWGAEGA